MNKFIYSTFILMLFTFRMVSAQYTESVHLKYFEYHFLKEYALRNVLENDKKLLNENKVRAVTTTNSENNAAYDSMQFNNSGMITRHVLLNSDIRNDFDGYLSFENKFFTEVYNLAYTDKNKIFFSQISIWQFTNFTKTDSTYRIIIGIDTLKSYFNSLFGNAGNFYKIEFYPSPQKRIRELTQTLQFNGKSKWDNINTKLIYEYDSENRIKKLTNMYNGTDEFWTIGVKYENNKISFTASEYNQAISDGTREFAAENYFFENNRIIKKEIIYPAGKDIKPISISTEYHYKSNGLIDYTVTNYSEYGESTNGKEAIQLNGTFKKYYHYEYYE